MVVRFYLTAHSQELIAELVDQFGGCTVTDGVGYWRNSRGIVISEQVWLYTSLTSIVSKERLKTVACCLLKMYDQECILYTIGNQAFFERGA